MKWECRYNHWLARVMLREEKGFNDSNLLLWELDGKRDTSGMAINDLTIIGDLLAPPSSRQLML